MTDTKHDEPMKEEQLRKGWEHLFSTENPYNPVSLKAFTKIVRWAEAEASRPAPAQAGDTLEDNVRHLLDRCPYTVRHKYKGGPESLIDSLCITFTKMQELVGKAASPAAKEGVASPVLPQPFAHATRLGQGSASMSSCGCWTSEINGVKSGHKCAMHADPAQGQREVVAPGAAQGDESLERLIEESGGHWKEDVFCIGGPELMTLLRAASPQAPSKAAGAAQPVAWREATEKALDALEDLLNDTQHAEHPDCDDGPCPVREARAVLSELRAMNREVEPRTVRMPLKEEPGP